MKHLLLTAAVCAAAAPWLGAQTKTAPAPPTKAATKTKAATLDLLRPDTIKGRPPAIFIVRLQTSKGNIDIRVVRAWAPIGVERFYNLVRAGYYDNNYFFRVLNFMAQTGISSRPEVNRVWSERMLPDDRGIHSNRRGTVTFATRSAPNSRSTQFFINKRDDNTYLDQLGFVPFGEVVEGMEVVDALYAGYGEPPIQGKLSEQGEPFIQRYFPRMDRIIKASILTIVEP
jgi:peptidyl-prolyl cis-trans isomerase A (cyclophilin A)